MRSVELICDGKVVLSFDAIDIELDFLGAIGGAYVSLFFDHYLPKWLTNPSPIMIAIRSIHRRSHQHRVHAPFC